MISVIDAVKLIQSVSLEVTSKKTPLSETTGMVLREPLISDRDLPPFDRVMMDGIAIQFRQCERGQTSFIIEGLQPAGAPARSLENPENCLEVMTGAALPGRTDTVIRYEDIEVRTEDGVSVAYIKSLPKAKGQNIHVRGTNRRKGDKIVSEGVFLSAAEIGVAATIGKSQLMISQPPEVAVVSTGDELVDIDEKPLPHQIRRSNVYSIDAALRDLGMSPKLFHMVDEKEEIRRQMELILNQFDIVIISGGVSKGKLDFIPGVLNDLGVKKKFHRVRQRPGKPFWFGHSPKSVVFALPGNPVASFVCYYRYIAPWIRKQLGAEQRPQPTARLAKNVTFDKKLTYFPIIKAEINSGIIEAVPSIGKGSSDLANLSRGDGFLELPESKNKFSAGESYPLYLYRNI